MTAPIPWHELLALVILDFFGPAPFRVEAEIDLSLKRQRLDLLIVHELSPEERLQGLPPEEFLKRLSPEQRLQGPPAEEILKRLSPEEIRAYLQRRENGPSLTE